LAFHREQYPQGESAAGLEAALYRGFAALAGGNGAPGGLRVDGICVSAAGPSLIPVTRTGRALGELWWFSPALRSRPLRSFFLPYVLWQQKHRPDDYRRTALYLSLQEYLVCKLGARPVTVLPTPAYQDYYWPRAELAAAGIDDVKFPPFVPPGFVAGTLSGEAAARTGLARGIPLLPAGPDFIMALHGCGIHQAGMVCDRAGSSEGINVCAGEDACAAALTRGDTSGLRILPHAVQGLWNVSVVIPESGSLFDRYRRENGLDGVSYGAILAALLPEWGRAGDEGEPPAPVSAAVRRRGRATLEKIALRVKDALETLRARGFAVDRMVVCGGQAKNARWNRYKSDKIGCALVLPPIADAELAGNARIAYHALCRRAKGNAD
jgi:xylulokinase